MPRSLPPSLESASDSTNITNRGPVYTRNLFRGKLNFGQVLAVWLPQNKILVLEISNLKLGCRVDGFGNAPGSIFHVNGALLLQSILFMRSSSTN